MSRPSRLGLLSLTLAAAFAAGCRPNPGPAARRGPRFLIVAPEAFHPALRAFAAYRSRELATEVASLERVLRQTAGGDDPERLKRYLYERWRRDGVRYALLVGDADVMPVRYMVLDRITPAAYDYAFYPSDLYYADVAKADGQFDDWNAQKEGFHAAYFGEVRGEKNKRDPINFDRIHYLPEIAVGRWPVSTVSEVEIVAAKTLRYERSLAAGAKPGANAMALIAVAGWTDGRVFFDRIASVQPATWRVEKRYYADAARNDRTPPPDRAQVVALLNAGVGLMFHIGHGSDTEWQGGCFSVADLAAVSNADRLPVLMSVGCSTARLATLPPYEAYGDVQGREHKGTNAGEAFAEPPPPPAPYQRGRFNTTGLGERLLRGGPNGAVAYIGCNTGGQPCALTLLEGFAAAAARAQPPRLGDCWSHALRFYFERERLAALVPTADWYPPSIFFQGMKYMLYGDPTLTLPSPRKGEG